MLVLLLCACSSPPSVEDSALVGDTDTGTAPDTDTGAGPSWRETVYLPYLKDACSDCHIEEGYIHPPITADPGWLVGQPSLDGLTYVVAGSLEESLLWHKVNGTQAEVGNRGERMPPPDDAPALEEPALAAVEAWILGGAEP